MNKKQAMPPNDDGDDLPANSPLRLLALEKKIRNDPVWRDLWIQFIRGYSAAPIFVEEVDYRVGSGKRNFIAEIWGPTAAGKSMVGLTVIDIIRGTLRERGIENPWALKWNYAQAKDEAFKYDGSGERVSILMDEDKILSGPNSKIAEEAYVNWLDQGRKLGHNLVKCSARRSPILHDYIACGLEVWGQLKDWLVCMLYDQEDMEIGFLKFRYPNKKLRDWYENEKDKSLHELALQGGNVGVAQTDDDLNANSVYEETAKHYAGEGKLTIHHFSSIANQLFGSRGTNNCNRWAGLALNKYKAQYVAEPKIRLKAKSINFEAAKFTDEGFEENMLQSIPEFQALWLDGLYFIPPRLSEFGDPSDYPDVIGTLKDGSIGIVNAKYWAWRTGDIVYSHQKMKSEILWHDKLIDRGFTEPIHILLFAVHKETKQVYIMEVPIEKMRGGSMPIYLPKVVQPPPPPSNLPSPPQENNENRENNTHEEAASHP